MESMTGLDSNSSGVVFELIYQRDREKRKLDVFFYSLKRNMGPTTTSSSVHMLIFAKSAKVMEIFAGHLSVRAEKQ